MPSLCGINTRTQHTQFLFHSLPPFLFPSPLEPLIFKKDLSPLSSVVCLFIYSAEWPDKSGKVLNLQLLLSCFLKVSQNSSFLGALKVVAWIAVGAISFKLLSCRRLSSYLIRIYGVRCSAILSNTSAKTHLNPTYKKINIFVCKLTYHSNY